MGLSTAVGCTDANDCTAVGDVDAADAGTGVPVYAAEEGGTWSTPTALSGTPDGTGELTSVSCVDEADCVGVGLDGNNQPIYASSHSAVVLAVSSVAPTVSSVAPQGRLDFERRAEGRHVKLLVTTSRGLSGGTRATTSPISPCPTASKVPSDSSAGRGHSDGPFPIWSLPRTAPL